MRPGYIECEASAAAARSSSQNFSSVSIHECAAGRVLDTSASWPGSDDGAPVILAPVDFIAALFDASVASCIAKSFGVLASIKSNDQTRGAKFNILEILFAKETITLNTAREILKRQFYYNFLYTMYTSVLYTNII